MFTTLLESRPKKERRTSGTIASVVLHLGLVFFAVYATANASMDRAEKVRDEKLNFVEVKPDEPKPEEPKKEEPKPKPKEPEPVRREPRQAPTPVVQQAPAPPKGFQIIQAPVTIPVNIPAIDLSKAVTNEADFSGKGVAGGSSRGVTGGTGDADSKGVGTLSNQPYFEFQVEEAASHIGGPEPEYPAPLREAGTAGRVVVQFVVSASGRVESGSVKIIESSNPAFSAAVRAVLSSHRFSPAKIGGRSVRQIVQQPFIFKLNN